jgi:hypothetical protein
MSIVYKTRYDASCVTETNANWSLNALYESEFVDIFLSKNKKRLSPNTSKPMWKTLHSLHLKNHRLSPPCPIFTVPCSVHSQPRVRQWYMKMFFFKKTQCFGQTTVISEMEREREDNKHSARPKKLKLNQTWSRKKTTKIKSTLDKATIKMTQEAVTARRSLTTAGSVVTGWSWPSWRCAARWAAAAGCSMAGHAA